jgi:TonB family protein
MRSGIAVTALVSLALVGVSNGRAQTLAEQARLLLMNPGQYETLHRHPDQQQSPPETVPDWAPPGTELPGKNGVTNPRVLHEARPPYTADAMRAKIQGTVVVYCIVEKNGSVGEARVVRSLDKVHGLDDEAVRTVKKWRFTPATRDGAPVRVVVSIDLTFTLR